MGYSEYSRSSPSAVPLPRRSLKPCCSRGTDLTHHSRGVQPCLGGALPRFVRSGNVSSRCCNMYILLVQHSTAHTLRGGTALQAVGGTSSTAPSAPLRQPVLAVLHCTSLCAWFHAVALGPPLQPTSAPGLRLTPPTSAPGLRCAPPQCLRGPVGEAARQPVLAKGLVTVVQASAVREYLFRYSSTPRLVFDFLLACRGGIQARTTS